MTAVNSLLDKYRETCSLRTDSAIAESLKMSRQGVHQWRKGLAWPSEEHIVKMATTIGEPAERWLASISLDRAPPAAKPFWQKLLRSAAAVAVLYLISRLDVHPEVLALAPLSIHYAQSALMVLTIALAWFRFYHHRSNKRCEDYGAKRTGGWSATRWCYPTATG